VNLVVAKAASIAGGLRIAELAPDLAAAFDRLMTDPARLDPGCAATTALVKALLDMEYLAERIYLAGIRHVQMEPSYGGPADAAVELRAASALGLALTAYDCVVFELVRLLTDPEWRARLAAARALACTGLHDVIPVLQHKAAVGDPEPEVTGECLVGLMTLAPGRYVPFVDSFVDHRDPAVREAAILAFGAVRSDLALQALARRWPGLPAALRGPALSALAMMRSDAALDFLINLIESAEEKVAAGAERVLLQHHDSENVRNRIQAARLRRQLLTE
jgi:HEAT repeat protein